MNDTGSASRVGSQFGPYRLLRLLGRGGMGEVYEAEDVRKRRVVALKLISPQFSGNPLFRARMQREAEEAGRLTEPHVVPIHDYGEIDGQLYLDMRFIEGTDLATLLKRVGPLSPPRAVAIVRQIAAALDAAHANGVTHRDVKPENILITPRDFAYLVDFGIARAAADPGLTQTGTTIGTYDYMAPERFTGNEVTYRADVYSLACVLTECLTGSPPYRAESIERVIGGHLTAPTPRPSQLRPGRVPVAFDHVIATAMAKNPEQRYRSAGDLAEAANDALTTSEQHQADAILRQGERAPDVAGPAGAEAMTQARAWSRASAPPTQAGWPQPSNTGNGSWRGGGADSRAERADPPDFRHSAGEPGLNFRRPPSWPPRDRKPWIVAVVATLLVVAVGLTAYFVTRPSQPSAQSTSTSGQSVLPFTGIDFRLSPGGVALDGAGNVFVTSEGMFGRVVKLQAGAGTTSVLPFNGLYQPQGVALDANGAVYVADFDNRVVKLAAGANAQTVLPFTGLNYPEGVAVDQQGGVYVADRGNSRVVKLAPGSQTQTVLPFTGLQNPDGVAVDTADNVYVTDTDNHRVLKLAPGSTAQTVLPITGLNSPWGIAVDDAGTVYVTGHDTNQVVKLVAGATNSTALPFTGLNTPLAVAVDKSGAVYVADRGDDRVVKLAP